MTTLGNNLSKCSSRAGCKISPQIAIPPQTAWKVIQVVETTWLIQWHMSKLFYKGKGKLPIIASVSAQGRFSSHLACTLLAEVEEVVQGAVVDAPARRHAHIRALHRVRLARARLPVCEDAHVVAYISQQPL